jgi:intraflagellar transport protein 172
MTVDALLLGDITTGKISEIPWRGSGNEKFDFTNSGVCMV